MKKHMKKGILLLIFVITLSSCSFYNYEPTTELTEIENFKANEEIIDNDEIAIKRIEVAKMIAHTFLDEQELNNLEPAYVYDDVNYEESSAKYVTAVSNLGIMAGDGINFRPNDSLTLEEAEYLLNAINERNEFSLYINDENKYTKISYGLWVDLFYNTLFSLKGDSTLYDKFKISEDTVIVLSTDEENKTITSKGTINNEVLNLTGYLDKEIKVLKKGNEVLAVLGITNDTPTINNTLIVSNTNESVTIFSGGAEREYKIINGLDEDLGGKICDITINRNFATHLVIYTNEVYDVVKSYTDTYIELEKLGIMPLSEEYNLYINNEEERKHKGYSDLVVGSYAKYIISDEKKVIASVIEEVKTADMIRVAINDSNFGSLVHSEINISATTDFKVKFNNEETIYSTNENFIINQDNINDYLEGRVYIEPLNDGLIKLNSITRSYGTPMYRGKFEIAYIDNGLTIINELTMDEYLYSVVPSEMPVSFGLEALKAQAVTARSYAYNQIYGNRFHKYGGNVDDSVSSQVYNNLIEQPLSNQAVDETSNMYIAHNGEIVSANFYSTSSGNTANSGEVWSNTAIGEFPTYTPEYLSSIKTYEGDYGDLSIEENADKFFRSYEIESYDASSSWFRWQVNMTKNELLSSINNNINTRYRVNDFLFEVTNNDGSNFLDEEILLQDLKDIVVVSRGSGGLITEIKLIDENKTVTVKGEYNIRYILSPKQSLEGERNLQLLRSDNSVVNNYSLLPSAFFTMDKNVVEDELLDITFYGGGNGHGVGMSQSGAKTMGDEGKSFEEILKYYYNGVEVIQK